MKRTVTESQFIDAFDDCGRGNQFSREARAALFDYLEDMERDTGEEYELDIIELCCEFSEYETALEAAKEYGYDPADDDDPDKTAKENKEAREDNALDWLNGETTVIKFDDGVIVRNF